MNGGFEMIRSKDPPTSRSMSLRLRNSIWDSRERRVERRCPESGRVDVRADHLSLRQALCDCNCASPGSATDVDRSPNERGPPG